MKVIEGIRGIVMLKIFKFLIKISEITMKKILLSLAIVLMNQSTFAFDSISQTTVSLSNEVVFSTAIIFGTSEISFFSLSDSKKIEAQKIQLEVQDYLQTGYINSFLGEKIARIQEIDPNLSNDESVDILIELSELILSK